MSKAVADLSEDQHQHLADIMFTYMVYEAPQGVKNIDALISLTMPSLSQAVTTDLSLHMHTLHSLAKQIVVPLAGCEDRLFAVELESSELTSLRNEMVRKLGEGGCTKQELIKHLSEYD